MASQLTALSLLSVILLLGVVISILANKIKISDILLLLIAGILLGYTGLFTFDQSFLTSLSIFALIMILFDSTSKFKLKEVSQLSPPALKLATVFLILSFILLSLATHALFSQELSSIKFLIISFIFGALMAGTAPTVILSILKDKKQKIAEILEFESIINTPLAVLIPFIVVDFYFGTLQANELMIKFFQGIMTGVGTGILIGIAVFSLMKKRYQELTSPLAVIASALVTYTLAENIGGNGVLAVTAFGIVFAAFTLKNKEDIQKFSSIFTNFLKIVVFIILGLIIKIPLSYSFILRSLALFIIYLAIRYLSTTIAFYNVNITKKEKMFMTLSTSKGIAVAVMIFLLSSYNIIGLKQIIDLSLLFILYTVILSSIVVKFTDRFITYRKDVLKKDEVK